MPAGRDVGMCSTWNIIPDFEQVIFAMITDSSRMKIPHQESSYRLCICDAGYERFELLRELMGWMPTHLGVFRLSDLQTRIQEMLQLLVILLLHETVL